MLQCLVLVVHVAEDHDQWIYIVNIAPLGAIGIFVMNVKKKTP